MSAAINQQAMQQRLRERGPGPNRRLQIMYWLLFGGAICMIIALELAH